MKDRTWDNGKYGSITLTNKTSFIWTFTEIDEIGEQGFAGDECIVAKGFVGYCCLEEPKGTGDIYTPFFEKYYQYRLEQYRQTISDISLIRNAKALEQKFLPIHIKEEQEWFKDSEVLRDYDSNNYALGERLYNGYRDYLNDKTKTIIIKTQHHPSIDLLTDKHQDEIFVFDDGAVKELKGIYERAELKEQLTWSEFSVMLERADLTPLLKINDKGCKEISNQVCKIYYKVWKIFKDAEVKKKWQNAAVSRLMEINPNANWKYITSAASKSKRA